MCSDRFIGLAGAIRKSPLHACAFFASKEAEYRVLLPFMKEGIEAGNRCVNIIDKAHREERIARLSGAGIDVAAAMRNGQLELTDWEQAHIVGGHFDQHAMLAGFDQVAANNDGQRRGIVRLWSNQEWSLQGLPGCCDLVEYESRFDEIWKRCNDVFVCVYDTTRFRGDILTNVLRAHPFAIVGGILRENPFYVPTRELLEELSGLPTEINATPALTNAVEGMAALGICESLLLTLTENEIVSEQDARGLLTDVATAHQELADTSPTPETHLEIVHIVQRLLASRTG